MQTAVIVDEALAKFCQDAKRIMTETPLEGLHDPRIDLKRFFERLDKIDDGTGERYMQFFGDRVTPILR